MKELQQYDTTKAIPFLLVLSSDKSSPALSKVPTVTLSKNGSSFVSATGTVLEVGNGWYKLTPSAADVATTGMLILHAEAASCENVDDKWWVAPDRGYLLCSTENSSGFNAATSTQYSFTALNVPSALGITGGLKGRLFSIISGTGAGQDRIISGSSVSVGVQILTFSSAFETTPDSTSVWVVTRNRLPSLDSSLRPSVLDSSGATFTYAGVNFSLQDIIDGVWTRHGRTLDGGVRVVEETQQFEQRTIVRGNSYASDARSLSFTRDTAATWPTDLNDGWTWAFTAAKHSTNKNTDAPASFTGTMAVIAATGDDQQMDATILPADIADALGDYNFAIRGTKTGKVWDAVLGTLRVLDSAAA